MCDGDTDNAADGGIKHASGHARVCWDTGVELSMTTKRTDCSNDKRALICVLDVGNIRKIGEGSGEATPEPAAVVSADDGETAKTEARAVVEEIAKTETG